MIRLGAVGYLNARPLVHGLDRSSRFSLRYDIPSECARLLHAGRIDLGLIPSIEYLRGGPYRIVPDLSIASRGPVASVAIYTTKPMADVRSIAMDTSSRTSIALVRVLCARLYNIQPVLEPRGPDLGDMLAHSDAALIIGDNALLLDHHQPPATRPSLAAGELRPGSPKRRRRDGGSHHPQVEKIDLGAAWTDMTGLPFVYAFWAGPPDAIGPADVEALTRARDAGIAAADEIALAYFPESAAHQSIGARYLRDNIKYYLGSEERTALEYFYRYSAECGVVPDAGTLQFF